MRSGLLSDAAEVGKMERHFHGADKRRRLREAPGFDGIAGGGA